MNSTKLNISLVILIFLMLTSCSGIKMLSDQSKASPKVVMSKGACFGECPVYTFTVYNSGLMKFNGVRYTKMDGKYEKQLTEPEYIALVKKIDKTNLFNFILIISENKMLDKQLSEPF